MYRSVYNKALNHLNSALIQTKASECCTLDDLINLEVQSYNQQDPVLFEEMKAEIDKIIESLPPQCKAVYKLSRNEDLKNREIAEELNISIKTVEKHITKALDEIRKQLIQLDLISILFCFFINKLLDIHA